MRLKYEYGNDLLNVSNFSLKPLEKSILGLFLHEENALGLNISVIKRMLGYDLKNKALDMRLRRALKRLVNYGILECEKKDGLLWYRPEAFFKLIVKCEKALNSENEAENKRFRSMNKVKRHITHINDILEVIKDYLNSLKIFDYGVLEELHIKRIILKENGKIKPRWILEGKIGLGMIKNQIMIRTYGYNRILDASYIKKDKMLFERYYKAIKVVISTSWIDHKALRLLERYGVHYVITLNYNVILPFLRRRTLKQKRTIMRKRLEMRKRLSRVSRRKIPENPPISVSKPNFRRLFLKEKIRGVKRLKKLVRGLIFRFRPQLEEIDLKSRLFFARWLYFTIIGNELGMRIYAHKLDELRSQFNSILGLGKGPPF